MAIHCNRAIAGLWNSGIGTIIRPEPEQILFLPQRPYMVLGTLREQLFYHQLVLELQDKTWQVRQHVGFRRTAGKVVISVAAPRQVIFRDID